MEDMDSKLKFAKRVNEQLEDDKEQLSQDVSYEKRRCHELTVKLDEHKKIVMNLIQPWSKN